YVIKVTLSNLYTALIYFKDAILALMMHFIIIGGIISGIFTATESGVIAVFYALIIGLFVYKEITFKDIWAILKESALTTTGIIFLIGSASVFIWYINFENILYHIIYLIVFLEYILIYLLFLFNFFYMIIDILN